MFQAPSVATAPLARILIVDDNTSKRVALRLALAPLGHVIVEADSGIAALRRVMENDFAVILMDVQMPDMDGFETVKLIRKRWQAEMTPILFITSYTSEEIGQADHYAGGAVDFIFAPIPPSDLRAKVSFFAHTYLEAQRLAAQAEAVQTSAAELQALTDSAPIGIFKTDNERRYVYTNPRWSEITGISAELAVGRAWDSVMEPEDGAWADPDLAKVTTFTHRFEVLGFGASRIGLITMQSMPDSDGTAGGWVGTLSDTTADTRANDALFDARDAALWASAMQRNFAASASHEIRTPTASIVGYLEEVLMSITIDDEDRELVEVAYRNAQRLSMLIDDLMMLDQCEIGAPTMHVEPTPLIPLVERVVSTFAAAAEDSGVQLGRTYDQAAQPALVALADPARLEQALTNLVGNAIKFTPSGGSVTVGVGIGDANQVQVTVTDTGMGIEAGDCSRIFERFYRSRGVADSAIPGSGLGLAIARVMVEAQAGSIAVTSQPGMGSTFSITLPAVAEHRLSSVPLTAVSAREQIVEDGPTSNMILVADDEPDIVALVSRRLTRSGFAVITAVNGEDALQMTRDQMPDLALLDVMMPKLTGIEVSRLLRTAPETHATPVILMSAGLFDKLTIPAVADAFIAKPFGEVELTDLVREVLGVHAGAGGRTLSSGAWGNSQP